MNPTSGLPCAMVRRSLSCARDRPHPRSQVISAGGGIAKARSTTDRPAALQSLSRGAAAGLPGPGAGTTRLRVTPLRLGGAAPWPPGSHAGADRAPPCPILQNNLDTTGTGRCARPWRRGSARDRRSRREKTRGDKAAARISGDRRPHAEKGARQFTPGWGLEDPRRRFKRSARRSRRCEHQPDRAVCPRHRLRAQGSDRGRIANNGAGHFRLSRPRPERPATEEPGNSDILA
jgi:hypothetical protein